MSQIDIFGESEDGFKRTISPGTNIITHGELIYVPNFFTIEESNTYFQLLRQSIKWNQESMIMYGKRVNFPRLTAWYGDNDKPYSFSGIKLSPVEWTTELLEIRKKLFEKTKMLFNSVLLNLYRNGNDHISWHSDDEKELGKNPIIASINFGQPRIFQLKNNNTGEIISVTLANGSLLLMLGETQHYWKHRVTKSSSPMRERINLTFRILN